MTVLTSFSRGLAKVATVALIAAPSSGVSVAGLPVLATAATAVLTSPAEAQPKGGRAGINPPGRHAHPNHAPRRRQYERRDRVDDRRDRYRRRHALGFLYLVSLPRGCDLVVVVDGVRYYYCGNVYYRPYIDNGTTIYVIKE